MIAELKLEGALDVLKREWEVSQSTLPKGEIPFLNRNELAEACGELDFDAEPAEEIAAGGEAVAANPALRALAWHLHHCLFRAQNYSLGEVSRWPVLDNALPRNYGIFYLVGLISGLSRGRRINREHSVPQEVARHTLAEVREAVRWFKSRNGHAGLTPHTSRWLALHVRGDLHRLGRLQYQYTRFWSHVYAFRSLKDGTVAALSEGGVRYRADGGAAHEHESGGWFSRFSREDSAIIGNPIDPAGRALEMRVELPLSEWRQALAPGDPVLNIHIPGDARLSPELCADSLARAMDFYPRRFPDRPFNAFVCESWLLNGFLARILHAESNIMRFQREFYLYPIELERSQLLREVFGEEPADWKTASRDNSFKRSLAEYFAAGGEYHSTGGGSFLLPQDLNWGKEVYLKQKPPWAS